MVQCLGLSTSSVGGPGSVPGQGTRSHKLQLRPGVAKKKKKKRHVLILNPSTPPLPSSDKRIVSSEMHERINRLNGLKTYNEYLRATKLGLP